MTDFLIKRLPYDLSSHAGLALIGQYLKRIKISLGFLSPLEYRESLGLTA